MIPEGGIVKMGPDDYKLVPLSEEEQKLVQEEKQTEVIGKISKSTQVRGENSMIKTLLKTEPPSGDTSSALSLLS